MSVKVPPMSNAKRYSELLGAGEAVCVRAGIGRSTLHAPIRSVNMNRTSNPQPGERAMSVSRAGVFGPMSRAFGSTASAILVSLVVGLVISPAVAQTKVAIGAAKDP